MPAGVGTLNGNLPKMARISHWWRLAPVLVVLAFSFCFATSAFAAAPPDPNTVGYDTVSSIQINGVTGTTAVVAPGADVSISANWSDFHPSDCPGCVDFLAVGYAGQGATACLETGGSTGQSGSGNVDMGPAPTAPGTYTIVAHYEFVFFCGQFWDSSVSNTYTAVAQIVVPGSARAGYCAGAGDTSMWTGAPIAAGTFLNLTFGQALTDSHYQGAAWAVFGQEYGLTCDHLIGLGYHDTGTKVDGTGTHTGTSADVYEYYANSP